MDEGWSQQRLAAGNKILEGALDMRKPVYEVMARLALGEGAWHGGKGPALELGRGLGMAVAVEAVGVGRRSWGGAWLVGRRSTFAVVLGFSDGGRLVG